MGDTFGQGPGRKGLSGTGKEEVLERRNTKKIIILIMAKGVWGLSVCQTLGAPQSKLGCFLW